MGALPCTRASPAAVGFDRWKPPDPTSASLPILLLGLRFLPQGWGSETPPGLPAHSARLQVMARALPFLYVLGHCKAPTVPLSLWD